MNKLIGSGLPIIKLIQLLTKHKRKLQKQSVHCKLLLVDNMLSKRRLGKRRRRLKNRRNDRLRRKLKSWQKLLKKLQN